MQKPTPDGAEVPVIETERLRLRGHRVADLPAMTEMWSDPEVTRFLNTSPLSPEDCWERLLRYRGHWSVMGYGYWALEERRTGNYVGEAGFANYRRAVEPHADLAPEAGWVLAREHQGKGYATEVANAIVGWGMAHFGDVPLRCIIHPEHTASLRVARKCGFVAKQNLLYKGSPTVLLERPGLLQQSS